MKFFYLIIFFMILACSTIKKEYVCGDHACLNKKEFNEYFSKNLIAEIKTSKNKKNKQIDLVKLNTETMKEKKEVSSILKKNNKIKAKEEKKKLKEEKIILLQKRKIKKIEEKKQAQEKKKLSKTEKIKLLQERKTKKIEEKNTTKEDAKILKTKTSTKEIADNQINNKKERQKSIIAKTFSQEKNITSKQSKKSILVNTIKTEQINSICDELKDCDIDKITELLIKKGRDKAFPSLSSN